MRLDLRKVTDVEDSHRALERCSLLSYWAGLCPTLKFHGSVVSTCTWQEPAKARPKIPPASMCKDRLVWSPYPERENQRAGKVSSTTGSAPHPDRPAPSGICGAIGPSTAFAATAGPGRSGLASPLRRVISAGPVMAKKAWETRFCISGERPLIVSSSAGCRSHRYRRVGRQRDAGGNYPSAPSRLHASGLAG